VTRWLVRTGLAGTNQGGHYVFSVIKCLLLFAQRAQILGLGTDQTFLRLRYGPLGPRTTEVGQKKAARSSGSLAYHSHQRA